VYEESLPNTQHVLDEARGEVVDALTGEVEEEHQVVYRPSVRASDYAEWESKVHHSVMVEERDRRLQGKVWEVGELVSAPAWLRQEVLWFLRKARALRNRPELCGKPFYPLKDKFILAAYYVVARKRGDGATADRIATMPCLDTAEPCYLSRRRGDPEFRKYLKDVVRYASYIYPNSGSDPIAVLDELIAKYRVLIPSVVYKRARELAAKVQGVLSGRRARTVAAAVLKIALDEVMVNSNPSNAVFKEICRKLRVSEQTVNEVVKKVVESKILQ
jgi:hypothetical protein